MVWYSLGLAAREYFDGICMYRVGSTAALSNYKNWMTSRKAVKVIPIFKPRKLANIGDSHRPISLLSPIVKVLGALILPTLKSRIHLSEHQHSFRKHIVQELPWSKWPNTLRTGWTSKGQFSISEDNNDGSVECFRQGRPHHSHGRHTELNVTKILEAMVCLLPKGQTRLCEVQVKDFELPENGEECTLGRRVFSHASYAYKM